MALVINGRVGHEDMQPIEIKEALKSRLPGLLIGDLDFTIQRNRCHVIFFCHSTSTLDYSVELAGDASISAAVVELVREAHSINRVLEEALTCGRKRAKIAFCLLEDERSRSSILEWDRVPRPLRSHSAKIAYGITAVLILAMLGLLYWQLQQPASAGRDFNLVTLVVGLGLPALTVPLPFVFEHYRKTHASRWVFSGSDGKTS